MSVYLQIIAVVSFQAIQIKDINFEVYKEEPQKPEEISIIN